MSLADPASNGVQHWEAFSNVNLTENFRKYFIEEDLKIMQDYGYISRKNYTVTQTFFSLSKKDFVASLKQEIAEEKARNIYKRIMKTLAKGLEIPLHELLSERYITKFEINQLHDNFAKRILDKVELKILPIKTI